MTVDTSEIETLLRKLLHKRKDPTARECYLALDILDAVKRAEAESRLQGMAWGLLSTLETLANPPNPAGEGPLPGTFDAYQGATTAKFGSTWPYRWFILRHRQVETLRLPQEATVNPLGWRTPERRFLITAEVAGVPVGQLAVQGAHAGIIHPPPLHLQ